MKRLYYCVYTYTCLSNNVSRSLLHKLLLVLLLTDHVKATRIAMMTVGCSCKCPKMVDCQFWKCCVAKSVTTGEKSKWTGQLIFYWQHLTCFRFHFSTHSSSVKMNMGCDFSSTKKKKGKRIWYYSKWYWVKNVFKCIHLWSFSHGFVTITKTKLGEATCPMKLCVCKGSGKSTVQNNIMQKYWVITRQPWQPYWMPMKLR